MKFRKAFTLMEINLAILIMAGGILSIIGLYSLGYRENRQSHDDVASTTYADAVISPIVIAASATNLKWSAFNNLDNYPDDTGWGYYLNENTGLVENDPEPTAISVFGQVVGKLNENFSWPSGSGGGLKAGLVVMHDEDSALLKISFRAAEKPGELMAAPLYYTEVRFQGVMDE